MLNQCRQSLFFNLLKKRKLRGRNERNGFDMYGQVMMKAEWETVLETPSFTRL